MTFGEVPVGHVFKFFNWGCACLFRKTAETRYRTVHACDNDQHLKGEKEWEIESGFLVEYDPFIAELEAQF